jgi:hypothetical protein
LIPDGTLAFKVDGTAVNLPSGLFYSLSLGTTDVDHNIDAADANTEDIAKIKTGENTGGFNSKDGTPKSIRPLNLANGINVQLVKDTVASPNINSEFQLDTDATIENKLLYVQVTFFKAVEIATFDPLNPLFDLEYVGHDTVQLWYAPLQVPGISTSAVLRDKSGNTTGEFVVTSNTLGVVYSLVRLTSAPVSTAAALLENGTRTVYTTVNTAQAIQITNTVAATTVDYLIVSSTLNTTSLVISTNSFTYDN